MLLEQPGRVGALRLKNRVVMAPMGANYSTTDGLSTERDKLYYAEPWKNPNTGDEVRPLAVSEVEYALVGDCCRPGDFLSCLRDAWMVAASVDHRFRDRMSRKRGIVQQPVCLRST